MYHVIDHDASPLKEILSVFGFSLPEEVHAVFLKLACSGFTVSFYYPDSEAGTHRYRSQDFAVDAQVVANKLGKIYGFTVDHTSEIQMVFQAQAISVVAVKKEITENQMAATVAAFKEIK